MKKEIPEFLFLKPCFHVPREPTDSLGMRFPPRCDLSEWGVIKHKIAIRALRKKEVRPGRRQTSRLNRPLIEIHYRRRYKKNASTSTPSTELMASRKPLLTTTNPSRFTNSLENNKRHSNHKIRSIKRILWFVSV